MSQTISFAGLSNNNCFFQTSLTLTSSAAIDTSVFTYSPEVVTVDPDINTIYVLTSEPSLYVSTLDITKESTINLMLTVNLRSSPTETT